MPSVDVTPEPGTGSHRLRSLRVVGWRTLGCVTALVALELVLSLLGYGKWTVQERDRFLGWRMLPSQNAWSRDLTVPERINGHGFRDREWERPPRAAGGETLRDPDLFRVAVVGNSMTFGTSVPVEETWPRVLEELLNEQLERHGDTRRALVMNFAVQGYVFEQMARNYEQNIRRIDSFAYPSGDGSLPGPEDLLAPPTYESRAYWRPDLLIVPTIPHDIAPMMPAAEEPEWGFRDLVMRTATYDWLVGHVIDKWIPKPPSRQSSVVKQLKWIDAQIQQKPFDDENLPYWKSTGARMAEVRAMVEEDGGRLALVNLPVIHPLLNPEAPTTTLRWKPWAEFQSSIPDRPAVVQVEPMWVFREAMAGLLPELRTGGLVTDERGMRHIRADLPHVDESVFLLDDVGHYNTRGHRVLATYLVHVLVAAGVLDAEEQ